MASINQTLATSYKDLEVKEITPPSSHPKYKSVVDGDPSPSSFRDVGDVDRTNWSELESTPACDDDKLRVVSCHNLMETVGVDWLPSLRFGGTNMQKTRAYQLWPGKNVFFFRGRIICGPDPRGFLLTTVSIIISSWIFCVYIGGDSSHHSGLITGFAVVLTLMVLVSLFMVSAIDPGIIPRNDKPPLEADIGKSDGINRKRVTVNGVEVKLKYCRICKIFRPPRSCHCAVCDNCVEKFDHHCPWIGQCIGVRNYRFYLMFLSSALVFFIYIFAFCCRRISRRMSQTGLGLFGMIGNCPETLSLATFSFVSIWFLGGLVSFHMYLITLNQTAYENYRQRYVSSPNPYYKGVLSNIKEVFFVRLPPSRVDFRAEVTPRWNVEGAMLEKSEESNFSNGGEAAKAIKTQASSETKGMSFQRSGTAILVDVA